MWKNIASQVLRFLFTLSTLALGLVMLAGGCLLVWQMSSNLLSNGVAPDFGTLVGTVCCLFLAVICGSSLHRAWTGGWNHEPTEGPDPTFFL